MSAALLVLLVTKIPSDSVEPKDTGAGTLAFFVGALLLTFAGFVLSAWRWQRVLAVFDVHVPLRTLLGFYLAGQFVGNVLPSTIGGDVLRVVDRRSRRAASDVAFASVVIERLTGFVALPLLTVVGILIRPSLLDVQHAWISIVIAGATVVALLVILVVAGSPRLAGSFAKHQNWMRFIGAVHVGVDRMRREPRRGVSVLVAAVAYQASVVAAVWCAVARARRVGTGRRGARVRARGGDGTGAADLPLGAGRPRGTPRAAAPPARRAHGQGDRRRAAVVRHDALGEPARRAALRDREPPPRRARAVTRATTVSTTTTVVPPDVAVAGPRPRRYGRRAHTQPDPMSVVDGTQETALADRGAAPPAVAGRAAPA